MDNMDIEDISDDSSDNEDGRELRVARRYIRDGHDPFHFYTESEFKRRFRFSKDSVMYRILPKIENNLVKGNNRGLPIAPVMQLLFCLRFYATANYQLVTGDLTCVSQSKVLRIIFRVWTLIAACMYDVIKMPDAEQKQQDNRDQFRRLGAGREGIGLPGVDGAIDCTHIRLDHATFRNIAEVYRNRKGYFSLNVQSSDLKWSFWILFQNGPESARQPNFPKFQYLYAISPIHWEIQELRHKKDIILYKEQHAVLWKGPSEYGNGDSPVYRKG